MSPIRFADCRLEPAERRLVKGGVPVELGARAFDLLCVLVQNAGRLVTKAELLDQVWPDVVVEEANLHVQMTALRKVIGREAIATVPGRGYQFVLALQVGEALPASAPSALTALAPSAAAFPAPAAPDAALLALPPLLGREDDLARVAQALAHPTQGGFVTLTGAGGSGKTLLARHLAARHGSIDGAAPVWVDLLEVSAPEALVPAVALAAQVPGPPRLASKLAHALGDAQLLLVLDNAEHLLEAVADLAATLRREAPGVRLLVTSQAPLRRDGETVHRLAGLSVPQAPCSAPEALRHAAVALFVSHARQADRRFRFDDAQVSDVVAVCASLGGSALGVQLAAALLGQMPLAAVRERLASAATGPDTAAIDPAANVLRSALSWSHDLLSTASQRVFRRLAIAQGPLPLALVQALAAEDTGPEAADDVTAALADLADRSLVHCTAAPEPALDGATRYRLLEAPRALALERLAAAGERAVVLARLAQALAPLGDLWHGTLWQGERPPQAHAALQAALPGPADIAAAFDAALQAPGLAAAEVLARMACLTHAIVTRYTAADRVRWAHALSARVDEAGLAPALQGRMLLTVTTLIRHSDWTSRLAMLNRAAAAWREAGDVLGEFRALAAAAEALATSGRLPEAEALLRRVRELDDPAGPPGRRRVAQGDRRLARAPAPGPAIRRVGFRADARPALAGARRTAQWRAGRGAAPSLAGCRSCAAAKRLRSPARLCAAHLRGGPAGAGRPGRGPRCRHRRLAAGVRAGCRGLVGRPPGPAGRARRPAAHGGAPARPGRCRLHAAERHPAAAGGAGGGASGIGHRRGAGRRPAHGAAGRRGPAACSGRRPCRRAGTGRWPAVAAGSHRPHRPYGPYG
jgi:predicted ATPase/DNA-binding winged helix-turn-helix (wHTH) protein